MTRTGRLVRASAIYMVWATVAGAVAVVQQRPAGFAGQATGLSAWQDFVFGVGTALSPPIWWIAVQLLLTRWAARTGRLSRVGIYGLIVFGVGECIGALGEPITWAIFTPDTFNSVLALIQAGMIVLPALMAVLGALALRKH